MKTSLTCYESPDDWYDHLPWVLLALRSTPKQDLSNYSPTELLFGYLVRLPREFFEEWDTNTCFEPGPDFAPNFSRLITSLSYFQPRKTNKQRFLDPSLFTVETTHVYVQIDNHKPPLSFVYKGPYKIIDTNPKYFVLDIKGKLDKILVNRLKVAYLSTETLNNEILLDTSPSQLTCLLPSNRASCDETPNARFDLNNPDSPETLPITCRIGRPIQRPAYLDDYVLQ